MGTTNSNSQIIPIRLEIESEGYALHETFTWHSPSDNLLLEAQVESLCSDFDLPISLFKPLILKSIKDQILDFNAFWPSQVPTELQGLRILVKLDCIVGNLWLLDQLEWAVFCPRNSPELFAQSYVKEMKLPAEFGSCISHAIREQCFLFLKALHSTGYQLEEAKDQQQQQNSLPIIRFNDSELAKLACFGPLPRTLRTPDLVDSFTPKPILLSEEELEKLLDSRKRENRRKKRSHSSLSTPPATHRTAIGYRGSLHRFAGSGASAEYENEDGHVVVSRSKASFHASSSSSSSSKASASKRNAKVEAVSVVCPSCSAIVLPQAQGICSKCGNIVPEEPTTSSSNHALSSTNHAVSALQPSLSTNTNSTQTRTSSSKRARKPPSTVVATAKSSNSELTKIPSANSTTAAVEYPIALQPRQPKMDPEPLSSELAQSMPEWLSAARKRLDERYPLDLFTICWEDGEFKMKCIECARTYAVGPHQSLSNFETHLKNKTHRGIVDRRLIAATEEKK